ncbi:unnamed protein product [Chondrus crispus]|uniref:Uncharacterized protein n=1 Tax=Chondrus crispus TaxID=2769 RepID=R7Q528_CHOCR|nr:unnamed protein product [Chondrus crispus]CDF33652.1 unnamed protein product [Chondrus crispus]|eukprot:XP_005713471.1 unnamed protein product [Chondrus crispus]
MWRDVRITRITRTRATMDTGAGATMDTGAGTTMDTRTITRSTTTLTEIVSFLAVNFYLCYLSVVSSG